MSKVEKPVTEETPAAKLGIETVTPTMFRKLIELLASEPIALAAWGPSGIGKTSIPMQVARDRGAPYIDLHMPTMTPEDFHIPTMAKDTTLYYDRRIPRRFQPAIEYVAMMKEKHGGTVPPHLRPIIAIEELNRAVDKAVTRGAFVLIGDRVIGDVKLDENYQFVVTMNPTGGGMAVNEFERDPAMRRRVMSVYMAASYRDFMVYAEAKPFHSEVLEYLRAHSSQFYDELGARAGRTFANPATWEGVSRTLNAFDRVKHSLSSQESRAAIAGYVGTAVAETLIEFIRDRTTTVTPDDVLLSYDEKGEIRKRTLALLSDTGGKLDRLTDLIMGLTVRIFSHSDKDMTRMTKNIATFMGDLPEELFLVMAQSLAKEAKEARGDSGRAWFQKFNAQLNKEPAYTKSITKFHGATNKAREEAKAAGLDV